MDSEQYMTCFFPQLRDFLLFFFFSIHDTMYCATLICAHTGSIMLLRTCKLLSIQQSKKRCFPMSPSSLETSSVTQICIFKRVTLSSSVAYFPTGRQSQLWFEGSFGIKSERRRGEDGNQVCFVSVVLSVATLYFTQSKV